MTKYRNEPKPKRLVHLTEEQERRMADQKVQHVQSFTNEFNHVQSRRCELMAAIIGAQVTYGGIESLDVEKCQQLACKAIDADAKQKWEGLRDLFIEMNIDGPQPHLEWAARQVGVTLFDKDDSLIQPPTVDALIESSKVIQ